MEKLEDIRGIRPIFEWSDYIWYLGALLGGVALLTVLVIILYRLFFAKNKVDLRAAYIKELEAVDLSDSKKAAYAISRLVRLIAAGERERKMAEKLTDKLETYKYAKAVPPLDEDAKAHYKIFLGMVHE
jgi:hypothetical protein